MGITGLKLLSAYQFLSYDMIDRFTKELWLTFINIDDVKSIICDITDQYTNSYGEYYENMFLFISKISFSLHQTLKEKFNILLWWIRNIFISGGIDRVSEYVWRKFSVQAAINPNILNNLDKEYKDKIIRIGIKCRDNSKKIDSSINQIKNEILTGYNRKILNLLKFNDDSIETSISLIISRNLFVKDWEKEFSDVHIEKLIEIYNIGKELTPSIMPKHELCFPGSWRYELMEYYDLHI